MTTEAASAAPSAAPAAPAGGDAPSAAPAATDAPPALGDGLRGASSPSRAERAAKGVEAARAKAAGDAPPSLGDAPAAEAAPEPAAGSPAPAAPAVDPAQQRAMQDAIRAERESYETKQRLKALDEENKKLKAESERFSKMSELELLEARGKTFQGLAEDIAIHKKYEPKTAEQLALESTKTEVEQLKEKLAAREAKEAAAEKEQKLSAGSAELNEKLKAASQHYPTLSAFPWAGRKILELHEQNPEASYDAIAAHIEKQTSADLRHAFGSEAALKALLADPDIKARVSSLLGAKSDPSRPASEQGKTRSGNPPDAIPATRAADPGSRSQPPPQVGANARTARALAAVETHRRANLG